MNAKQTIRRWQNVFRERLWRFRHVQLVCAQVRADQAKRAWEAQLAEWNRQRRQYLDLACPLCGGRRSEECCLATVRYFRRTLRRMAGICDSEAKAQARHGGGKEWRDWNRGREGPRKCGPALWENVVRMLEEDR